MNSASIKENVTFTIRNSRDNLAQGWFVEDTMLCDKQNELFEWWGTFEFEFSSGICY